MTASQRYEEDIQCLVAEKNGRGGIYIGNLEAAQNLSTLSKHGIKAVISVARGGFLTHSQDDLPNYMYLPALDCKEFDLAVHFSRTFDFIDRNRKKSNVLVHCMAGISRSATIIIAYLMRKSQLSMVEAYTVIKRIRTIVQPNTGFVQQLKKYEQTLKGGFTGSQTAKQNRSTTMVRNKSSDIVVRRETPDRHEDKYRAEEKIKAINLEEKINALRQRFGGHQRKNSFGESKPKNPRPSLTFRESLLETPPSAEVRQARRTTLVSNYASVTTSSQQSERPLATTQS